MLEFRNCLLVFLHLFSLEYLHVHTLSFHPLDKKVTAFFKFADEELLVKRSPVTWAVGFAEIKELLKGFQEFAVSSKFVGCYFGLDESVVVF